MAKKPKTPKTNAIRALDVAGIPYEVRTYEVHPDAHHDLSMQVAESLGEDPNQVFKTLVLKSPDGDHVVCCLPSLAELDLKVAAVESNHKSLSMIAVKDIEKTTGYIRGGCSPVGMKKQFTTLIDESALLFDTIVVSGGKPGVQLVVNPEQLADFVGAKFCDLVRNLI